jgi:hypothetical protein
MPPEVSGQREHNMRLVASGVRRVLCGALALGLAVVAPAVVAPAHASASGVTRAVVRAAVPAAARHMVTGSPATIRPKARNLAANPRERAWRSRFLAHPVPAPSASAPAVPAALARRLRSAAAREALRHATVSTCSGQIMADTLYSCQAPSTTGTGTYTLTLPAGPNVLVFQTTDANDSALHITVTAPDSTTVICQRSPVDECATSQQGTYAVAVSSGSISYTLEFTALLTETNCPVISLSMAGPAVKGTVTAGQTGACYSLGTSGPPAGHVLRAYMGIFAEQMETVVFDSAGSLVCAQVTGNCTLTGTGPYRVLVSVSGQPENPYEFQVADLTDPAGCVRVAQQVFGTVPALSADLCSSLTVTASGSYQIYSVAKVAATRAGTLYTPSGGNACTGTGPFCQLTPGTYNFVQDDLLDGDHVATVFIAAAESRGCVAAGDTAFAAGDATGTFAGPGEELCRTLPTSAGLSDYVYSQPASGSLGRILEVVDSAGTQMCPGALPYSGIGTCALTGIAPFRVILVGSGPGHFRLLVQRTDSTAGCASWPRSGYGNAAGAHVTLTNADNARCFVIPPAGRAAAELVEDADSTDGAAALLTVNDPSGKTLCSGIGYPTNYTVCDYKAGVTYTALLVDLVFPAAGARDTYSLVRRDLTGQAACSSPVSTSPGGPTTSFALGSSVAARCFRVSAVKADKFLFALRSSAPYDSSTFSVPSATILITNGSGTLICSRGLLFCAVGGSAGYQAIVLTVDYTDVAITVHLDSWLVGTSAGWVAACQRHRFSTGTTSAAVSDTLTDSADAYCGVIDMQPNQFFSIYGSSTAILPSSVYLSAYPAGSWATPTGNICGVSGSFSCKLAPDQPTQALLIAAPFGASQDPISFDMQGVCTLGCSVQPPVPVATSISPAAQPAGQGNIVVVSGTGLNFSTQFSLVAKNGSEYSTSVPVSVNAAGTRLTLRLDTTQVPPGTYGVAAGNSSLLKAYRVTKAPAPPPATRFVPLTPARVLDTQTGLAARRARVPAHGTITFPVTGRAGVPAARVAAVVLDVSAVAPSRSGYLTVYPAGSPRPSAEAVEFAAGRSMTGLVTVPVVNGRVAVYNGSAGSVDLTADVVGYDTTAAKTGALLTPVGPVRVLNPARVDASHALTLKVAGAGGVPAHGTEAVALDLTVTRPAKGGHLTAYADRTRRPAVTSLSFAAGQQVTELVIARVTDGKVDLYNASGGTLRLTADAVGYYSAAGSVFRPVRALRVMDTRTGFGSAGEAILPHAAAKLSPLWNTVIPASATVTAVLLNVTALGARSAGALTVFRDGPLYQDGVTLPNSTSLPGTPNIAFLPGQAQSNLVIVPTSGLADFYNGSDGNLQLVADLEGYYTR